LSRLDELVIRAPNVLPRLVRLAPARLASLLRRPVFLVGCGRSGKTVVAELLGQHPGIARFPDEANHLWHPRLYPWRDSALKSVIPPMWVDPARFTLGSLDARTQRDVDVLRGTLGTYQALRGKPVLLSESALITFMIPFLRENFGNPLIVHLVRDGRAVAAAWASRQSAAIDANREKYRSAGLDSSNAEVLERCAASWNAQVLEVARWSGDATIPTYRYEEFCDDPLGVVSDICVRAGLDPGPVQALPVGHVENRNDVDMARWSTAEIGRVEGVLSDGLRLYGYA
jgi:hypothetical protein